jgi:hypothetical protein
VVSRRQIYEFIVFRRQKHVEQCFSDQATNEKCHTDKFPFLLLFSNTTRIIIRLGCIYLHMQVIFTTFMVSR